MLEEYELKLLNYNLYLYSWQYKKNQYIMFEKLFKINKLQNSKILEF